MVATLILGTVKKGNVTVPQKFPDMLCKGKCFRISIKFYPIPHSELLVVLLLMAKPFA